MNQETFSFRYEKWASGKLVCICSDYFNGGTGTSYRGGYYLGKTLEYPEQHDGPAFVEAPYITGITCRGGQGWACTIQLNAIYKNKAMFWVVSPNKSIPKFYVDYRLEGSWK